MSSKKLDYDDMREQEPCFICGAMVNAEHCFCFGCNQVFCGQHNVEQYEMLKVFPEGHQPEDHNNPPATAIPQHRPPA